MTTNSEHEDLFFNSLIEDYLANPRFLRRDWLATEVLKCLDDMSKPFALLTAEPGFGKTAFMAQLAQDHPGWLRYFIRRDQRETLSGGGARSFLMRLGFQLAEQYPNLFIADDIVLDVEQDVAMVDKSGFLLGVDINKLIASPFYKKVMIKVKQTVQQAGGSAVGIRIDTIISDPRLLPLDDLQHLALFSPARRLAKPLVILVDALDELRYHDTGHSILEWLTSIPIGDLPPNLRFVLTSRPPDLALDIFSRQKEKSINRISLKLDEQIEPLTEPSQIHLYLQEDTRTYLDRLVASDALKDYWNYARKTSAEFLDEATNRSEGNLGFLDAIARVIEQADEDTIKAVLSLNRLPNSLNDLYVFFLQKIRDAVKDDDIWDKIYVPVLAVLSVAYTPLTKQQLHSLGHISVSLAVMSNHLDRLLNFLDVVEGNRYRLYHSTFADLLVDPETALETPEYYVDSGFWHKNIANYYWEEYVDNWSICDTYGLVYLSYHLTKAGADDRLLSLLTSYSWLNTKLSSFGVDALLTDFYLTQLDDASRYVQHALRLATLALRSDQAQLPSQLIGRLQNLENPVIIRLRQQALAFRATTYLSPVRSSLTSPGSLQFSLSNHTSPIAFIDDRKINVISASSNGDLYKWNIQSGRLVTPLQQFHKQRITELLVSLDYCKMISCDADRRLGVWNLSTNLLQSAYEVPDGYECLAIVPGRPRAILTCATPQTGEPLSLWDWEEDRIIPLTDFPIPYGLSAERNGYLITKNSQYLLLRIGRQPGLIGLWSLETGGFLDAFSGTDLLANDSSGNRVIILNDESEPNTLTIWNLQTCNAESRLRLDSHFPKSAKFYDTPAQTIIVSGGYDNRLVIWNLQTGMPKMILDCSRGIFAPVPEPIGSFSIMRKLRWQWYRLIHNWIYSNSDDAVKDFDLDENCDRVITVSGRFRTTTHSLGETTTFGPVSPSKTLLTWNLKQMSLENYVRYSDSSGTPRLTFISDCNLAVSSGERVQIFDLQEHRSGKPYTPHQQSVDTIKVNEDGLIAVSTSGDGVVSVWDCSSGELLWKQSGLVVELVCILPIRRLIAVKRSGQPWIQLFHVTSGLLHSMIRLETFKDASKLQLQTFTFSSCERYLTTISHRFDYDGAPNHLQILRTYYCIEDSILKRIWPLKIHLLDEKSYRSSDFGRFSYYGGFILTSSHEASLLVTNLPSFLWGFVIVHSPLENSGNTYPTGCGIGGAAFP